MPEFHLPDSASLAGGGDAAVGGGGQSHTCGHEAVCGQQKLRGDLHPHLRVGKLEQGEVVPLPLPVWDPLLFPVVGCRDTGHRRQPSQNQFSHSLMGQIEPLGSREFLHCVNCR